MIALKVTVPVACFRKGFAREYWETEDLPPPSTCYGFLLSLVGERDRRRHVGARVGPALLHSPDRRDIHGAARANPDGKKMEPSPPYRSTVLRTLWRVKDRKLPPGVGTNARPDFQELLTDVRLALWLDSSEESAGGPTLEDRVAVALDNPSRITRFGGLSLGESTHLVNEVSRLRPELDGGSAQAYLLDAAGRLSLPVWVDHVGAAGTRFAVGELVSISTEVPPPAERLPRIEPRAD